MNSFTANIAGRGACRVTIANGRIECVDRLGSEDRTGLYCSPGFIDLQINGFAGVDFSAPDLSVADIARALPAIWATGCTTFCPTLITNSIERLARNFTVLEQARRELPDFALSAPCYHLEGPYLSPGPSHGAHDPSLMHAPSLPEFRELQRAASNNIGILTIAPELPGALPFAREVSLSGTIVAISHTDGDTTDVYAAVAAGATLSTHWGNGCPGMIHRHHAPLWAQLECDDLCACIICDGFHLPREHVRIVNRVKGVSRCILVTDAVHVAGLPPGRYQLVGQDIDLQPNGQVLTADGRCMAGSTLAMNAAIGNFMRMTGLPLADALRPATETPARVLRRPSVCEAIRSGEPAHLVVFQVQDDSVRVVQTLLGGRVVHGPGTLPNKS